jgi:hypothetical protein
MPRFSKPNLETPRNYLLTEPSCKRISQFHLVVESSVSIHQFFRHPLPIPSGSLQKPVSMCFKDVATKIYECGDRIEEDLNFKPCKDMTAPEHKVTVNPLGSNRVKGKCGRVGCRNP